MFPDLSPLVHILFLAIGAAIGCVVACILWVISFWVIVPSILMVLCVPVGAGAMWVWAKLKGHFK